MKETGSPLRILASGIVRAAFMIMVLTLQPSTPGVEAQLTTQESFSPISIHGISITRPAESVHFNKVGRLFPTLNFGHLRTTVKLQEFRQGAHNICSIIPIFKKFSNYTSPLSWRR